MKTPYTSEFGEEKKVEVLKPLPLKEFNSKLDEILSKAWEEYEKGGEG